MTEKAKRYEFTGETKIVFGRTLKQIRALVAMVPLAVNVGDLGGWIFEEANLPQSGTGWVFPGGMIRGGTIRGGTIRGGTIEGGTIEGGTIRGGTIWDEAIVTHSPLVLSGLKWEITISDEHMKIGCKQHRYEAWLAFDGETIAAMDPDATRFWAMVRPLIEALVAERGRHE